MDYSCINISYMQLLNKCQPEQIVIPQLHTISQRNPCILKSSSSNNQSMHSYYQPRMLIFILCDHFYMSIAQEYKNAQNFNSLLLCTQISF